MEIRTFGASFTRAAKYDRDDARPELEKIQVRRRMRIALEAADAFEPAVRENLVCVHFAAIDNDGDPLDMTLEFAATAYDGADDRVNPVFRFNLRDAFLEGVRDMDWGIGKRYRVVADGLEVLLAEMRAELAMFSKAEAEDRADHPEQFPE